MQSTLIDTSYSMKILIVDDEIFNIEALKCILESVFHFDNLSNFCDFALNGFSAYEKVKKNVEYNNGLGCDYHLILMDNNMPIMDGCESSEKIRTYLL